MKGSFGRGWWTRRIAISDLELNEKIRAKLPSLEGVKFEVVDISQMFMGGARNPVEIKIFGQEIPLLKEIAETIVSRIKDVGQTRISSPNQPG